MLFAGTVTAAPIVNVTVLEDFDIQTNTGTPVTLTNPSDDVMIDVNISGNDESTVYAEATIWVDPENGLKLEPEKAMMWDGTQYISNDPSDPFLYNKNNYLFWDIAKIWGWSFTSKNQTQLLLPATVTATGKINVTCLFGNYLSLRGNDNYTFYSINTEPDTENGVTTKEGVLINAITTIPMQTTGVPIAVAMLGLLGVIGGTVYNNLK